MTSLPHETASSSRVWREEWSQILTERDRLSCLQEGRRGPPFATHLATAGQVERWLPWNWFSLGRGWCFDADWDELVRCSEIDSEVDWNGVALPPPEVPPLPLAHVLLFSCCLGMLLLWFAYREWAEHERSIRTGGEAPSLLVWLRGRSAAPWRWRTSPRLALAGAAVAVCVSWIMSSSLEQWSSGVATDQ